jgi:hypothetical protein
MNMIHFLQLIDGQIVPLNDIPKCITTLYFMVAGLIRLRLRQYFGFFTAFSSSLLGQALSAGFGYFFKNNQLLATLNRS